MEPGGGGLPGVPLPPASSRLPQEVAPDVDTAMEQDDEQRLAALEEKGEWGRVSLDTCCANNPHGGVSLVHLLLASQHENGNS